MTPLGQPASEEKRRRSPRAKVFLSAVLECPGSEFPVVLRNLSEHGALVEGKGLTPNHCEVHLRRNGLDVGGHVAWAQGNRAGIAFTQCLSPEVVMEHVARPAARPAAEPVRRPAVTQRGMSMEERRWFDEMRSEPK